MTPSEIEPATSRLVVQCLNQLRYRVPQTAYYTCQIIMKRIFLTDFSKKKIQAPNRMKIRAVGAEMFHAARQRTERRERN